MEGPRFHPSHPPRRPERQARPSRESYHEIRQVPRARQGPQEAAPLPVLGHLSWKSFRILIPPAPGFQGEISGRDRSSTGAAAPRASGHGLLPRILHAERSSPTTDNVRALAIRLPSPGVWILKSVRDDRRPGPRSRPGRPLFDWASLAFLAFRHQGCFFRV